MANVSNIGLAAEAKALATPIIRKLMSYGSKMLADLKNEFIIEDQEISFLCPENIQKWSIYCAIKKGALFAGYKRFSVPAQTVSIRSILPLHDLTNQAIERGNNNEIKILFKPLKEDQHYVIDFEFEIPEQRFLDALVYRNKLRETPYEDRTEFWMCAQLKFVELLKQSYSAFRLEDIDFNVNVAVHQEIKAKIPSEFQRDVELIVKWMKALNPEEKQRLSRQHLLHRRGHPSLKNKDTLELLDRLQDIFTPKIFRGFIDVKKDFHYHDCLRGLDFYALPFPTWPKFMQVVSRTSLTCDRPAAEGTLIFNTSNFKKEVEKAF